MYMVRKFFSMQNDMCYIQNQRLPTSLFYIPSSRPGLVFDVKNSRCVNHLVNCHNKISDKSKLQKEGFIFGSGLKDIYSPSPWEKGGDNRGFSYDTWGISQLATLYLQLIASFFAYLFDQNLHKVNQISLICVTIFLVFFSFICSVY